MIAKYFYLIWVLIYFIIWLVFFILRKDTRDEMIKISILFGLGGILSQFIYIKDWWQPINFTNTPVGIEDFLIGFFIGGISSIIYTHVFSKRKILDKKNKKFLPNLLITGLGLIILFFGCFFILKLHSFYSLVIGFILPTIYIYINRKDLIKCSLISGLLMLILGIIIYLLLFLIDPNYIQYYWLLPEVWFSKLFLGIPIAEYIWYFLAGAFIGPLYAFWKEAKLTN